MKQVNWYQIFGNAHTIPDGSTVTPTDDVQILLNCANIWNKAYTTIAELLADTDSLLVVIDDNNAIDYLVRSTTFASAVTADSTAMTDIGLNNYASNTLLADSTWCTAICNSTYFESVLNVKVPTMTSNTTPEGEVIRSSVWNSTFEGYCAFDNNASTLWQTVNGGNVGQYIGYKFVSANKIFLVKGREDTTSPRIAKYKIQGSNDGFVNDTHDLTEEIANPTRDIACTIASDNSYSAYRLYITAVNANSPTAQSLQFYGREDV